MTIATIAAARSGAIAHPSTAILTSCQPATTGFGQRDVSGCGPRRTGLRMRCCDMKEGHVTRTLSR